MGMAAEPITLRAGETRFFPTTANARSANLTQFRHLWYTISMKNEMQAALRAAQYRLLYPYERYYPVAGIPGPLLT